MCLNKVFVLLSTLGKVTCSVKITGLFSNDEEEVSGKSRKISWTNIKHTGKISRPHTTWDLKVSKCQETLKRLMEVGQLLLEIREATFWQALLVGTARSLGEANSFHPRRLSRRRRCVTKPEVSCLEQQLRC